MTTYSDIYYSPLYSFLKSRVTVTTAAVIISCHVEVLANNNCSDYSVIKITVLFLFFVFLNGTHF